MACPSIFHLKFKYRKNIHGKKYVKLLGSESMGWLYVISYVFEKNKILFEGQHGFKHGRSCETALHEIISKLNDNQNKRLVNLLLFIYFKKGFDTVDADLLILKLFHSQKLLQ